VRFGHGSHRARSPQLRGGTREYKVDKQLAHDKVTIRWIDSEDIQDDLRLIADRERLTVSDIVRRAVRREIRLSTVDSQDGSSNE
jgi:hypothetical protein